MIAEVSELTSMTAAPSPSGPGDGGAVIERTRTFCRCRLVLKDEHGHSSLTKGARGACEWFNLSDRSATREAVSPRNSPKTASIDENDRDLRSSHGRR